MVKIVRENGINKVIILLLVLVFIILATNAPRIEKYQPVLNGTYHCDKLPFVTISFDKNYDYSFYYYNGSESDKGTYSQETKTTYVINSPKFHNEKITFDGKNQTFKIHFNDETYVFKQSDSNPTIINDSER